ncbi:hypothetical protein MAR_020486 [Mya arenaria]|uniref:Fibronectin type-III domain-containing protein n=1 Tax=Mya arenaria TaxID=6604 RepID=A0ABY7E833_MYAAR|nr:hypothetical protein MAR_020486 [Mya arenaria]
MDLLEYDLELRECEHEICDTIIVNAVKNWSNEKGRMSIQIKVLAIDSLELPSAPNYIVEEATNLGLHSMHVVVSVFRGQESASWVTKEDCRLNRSCSIKKSKPISETGLSLIDNGFLHGDRIVLNVLIRNGGIIYYQQIDGRTYNPMNGSYYVNGIEKSYKKELEFDMADPSHCKERNSSCIISPLWTSADFLPENKVKVFWEGWTDKDSGIYKYEIQVYLLVKGNSNILRKDYGPTGEALTTLSSVRSAEITLEQPGPYAVELTAFDHAGNHKTARKLFFFDGNSDVSLNQSSLTRVLSANKGGWINKDQEYIVVDWAYRFSNNRHHKLCWLCRFDHMSTVIPFELDDTAGVSERTWERIPNIQGIVRFELAYLETYDGKTTKVPSTAVTQFEFNQQQIEIDNIALLDGKKVQFTLRGYDVMDAYAEDNATVWIDTSPPVIENLWLSRGDIINISVHNVAELANMTIEWKAFDVHSGLYEISWRLFDNFSRTDVVHGHSYESPQHGSSILEECERFYTDYARGPSCYCSPYHGCFHQHFQVIPTVIDLKTAGGPTQHLGGIDGDKSEGVHEREYYIEVTAANNAGLSTLRTHKITIDVSPPNTGHVHDGVAGQPEVDFQQSLTLSAHWDDFLDKESGIKFYLYSFKTRCLSADEMYFDKYNTEIVKTYETTARTTVQSPGRYYTTVVAYNHALDPSVPVCSDGVVIDSTPTLISEVVIHGGIVTPRIVRDIETDEEFVLNRNREIQAVRNPTNICRQRSFDVPSMDIQLIPKLRNVNGSYSSVDSTVCESIRSVSNNIVTFLRYDSHLEMSWNYTESPSGVNSFEIGLSSDNTENPNIMSFQSSMHHSFMRLIHPGIWDGQEFFILLKVTSKAGIRNTKVIGPVMVVKSKPEFKGFIHINTEGNFMIASWGSDDFVDYGESGDLRFEIAVGSARFTSNVVPFSAQRSGGSCNINDTTSCTAVDMRSLKWALHENTDYYVTVKATDPLGLFVVASSERYTRYYELPSSGVVYDIDIDDNRPFVDIDDIDFQSKTSELAVRWNGFYHHHSNILFKICVQDQNGINIVCETASSDDHHTFYGLCLRSYERYYQEVTAMSASGNVTALSDGVVVVIPEDEHPFEVFDGNRCNCTVTKGTLYFKPLVDQFDIFNCTEDIDYQYQTSSLNAYWWLPEDKRDYMQTILWRIEKRALVVDMWTPLSVYQTLRNRDVLHVTGLYLIPGRKYRISVKACAQQFCFKSMSSDGVFIIPNPPITGSFSVNYDMGENTIAVTMDRFKDSDLEDVGEALSVIMRYEYAFADGENDSKLLYKWDVINITSETETKLSFDITLDQKIRFAKCWKLTIKGITKAGTYTIISSEIRNCSNLQEVKPSIVIDAVGKTIGTQDGHDIGGETFLEQNHDWSEKDKDYTSFTNIISAVWPKLRYKYYNWAVLSIGNEDPTIFYDSNDHIDLRYPCTHPETKACGETEEEYMNAKFDTGVLKHGKRYIVCIHANETYIYHEKWTQHLGEFMECSDGVTVDITPPISGKVWIGQDKSIFYQTSTSDILVMWDSFSDIEEHQYNVHESGIAYYAICLGTSPGGNDVINFVNVGLVNHKVFHNLLLQNGLSYYATVKGYDHVGLSTSEISHSVLVDSTTPTVTGKSIQIPNRHLINASSISACWTNVFEDKESGINRYEWSVGTNHGYEDVLEYTTVHGDCAESELHPSRTLTDGHSYFVTVKAYNNAGLFSTDTSWAFVVDTTPPDSGLVYDGPNDGTYTDKDYMTSSNIVQAYWTHFVDAHTPVREYFVSVGTCKECDDVLTEQSVGITTEIEVAGLVLMEGRVYYTTVKACNTAMLCSRATSDGFLIDKSQPTRGTVIDGLRGSDIEYQASRTHVGCKWFGFSDPQSGLSHYVWRLGTLKGGDDIVSATNVHNHEIAYIIDVQSHSGSLLPVGRPIYCTVRAYNKAGFYSEISSNGFVVDTSPPAISKELTLSPFGRSSSYDRTTLLRSSLKVHWDTSDSDSGISAQYLSVSSHMGGEFNISTIKIDAVATDYTLLKLDLHDGSYYDIKLTVCNGAKLCTHSLYENLLVDSTPPTMGTFAINTDHASELGRQPENWMKWNPIMLNISWLGFEDIHSGIDTYIINVGTRYMANDLNKNSENFIKVKHVNIGFEHQEGFVQTHSVRTKSLSNRKSVYVSVYAINAVGLHSPILHAQFNLLFGGILSMVRRCEAETCLGHCVCAPVPEKCHFNSKCVSGSNENVNAVLIRDHLDIDFNEDQEEVQYSPFDSFLAAKWTVVDTGKLNPLWFEWSIGELNYETPKGVFNETDDRVWHDAGSHMSWMYVLPRGRFLQRNTAYSFFVRAWYDDRTFVTFKSNGVTILSKPPHTTNIRGVSVKEVLFGSLKDVDYISYSNHVMVDWTGKFLGDSIKKFYLYLSTHPNGKNMHVISTNINASVTKYDISGAKYKENTRYFSVVQAFNHAGLHTTLSSDGFMLDTEKPEGGTVNDGIVLHDVQFLNSSNQLPSFWYGFSDAISGIDHYEHCVSSLKYKGRCDIQPFINVGLWTYVERKSHEEFIQGAVLFSEVRAYDMAGHTSDFVASDGILIDRTPPFRVTYVLSDENLVRNGSFEYAANSSLQCEDLPNSFWKGHNSCLKAIKAHNLPNGNSYLLLQGSVSQEIFVEHSGKFKLQFYTSNMPTKLAQMSVQDGFIVVNETKHVFVMHKKTSSTETGTWQEHHFLLNLPIGKTKVTFGAENKGSFGIDDISIRYYSSKAYLENSTDVKHLQAVTIHAHDWSSIYSEWHFEDPESGIVEYFWAIGTVRGGTQLQEYTSVGRNEFASSNTIQLQHNTVVFVSVIAVNGAGLRTVSHSEQIYIDLTPPEFEYVYDGDSQDFDIQFQTSLNVSVAWSVKDQESGIQECLWAIGLSPMDTTLQEYTQIAIAENVASTVLSSTPYDRLYSTVRCTNAAGRTASISTDGLRVLNMSLATNDVYISLMAISETQYPAIGKYHGNRTKIKFQWAGFRHDEGINNCLISLVGVDTSFSETVVGSTSDVNFASFTGLNLEDGQYEVTVQAVNEIHMYSEKKTIGFYLLTSKPANTGGSVVTAWDAKTLKAKADWSNVFDSTHPLYYEVTLRQENGEGDLIQWQETTNTEIEITLKMEDISLSGSMLKFKYVIFWDMREEVERIHTLLHERTPPSSPMSAAQATPPPMSTAQATPPPMSTAQATPPPPPMSTAQATPPPPPPMSAAQATPPPPPMSAAQAETLATTEWTEVETLAATEFLMGEELYFAVPVKHNH